MDDDCVPADDALEEFLKADARHGHYADGSPGYGFLAGKVLWRDGSPCVMNIPRETVTRNLKDWTRGDVRIEMASFVSLFIPAGVVREVGLPYRQFYIWTDDWEYTRRISRRYPCYLASGSFALHDTEVNAGADIATASADRIGRFRYLYRNDVFLYRREGIRGFAYESARLTAHCLRIAAGRMSLGEKKKRIGILIRGTWDGLGFFPEPDRAMRND
jgi:GT2 family glycosyltransferase